MNPFLTKFNSGGEDELLFCLFITGIKFFSIKTHKLNVVKRKFEFYAIACAKCGTIDWQAKDVLFVTYVSEPKTFWHIQIQAKLSECLCRSACGVYERSRVWSFV